MFKKIRVVVLLAIFLARGLLPYAAALDNSYENQLPNKHPDYVQEFLGEDKFEKFNRKMFAFNSKLNKYALKPMHVVWASIMPKYGMDRIQGVYENALYPRRLVSTLIQGKFKEAGGETIRFLANSTIGIGGMFDPAKKYLKIEPVEADMEQALSKCKVKSGPYVVCPVLASASPRALLGKALDAALDPSSYVGIPFMALVKLGFTVNRTSYLQPFMALLESNYADPYDIARKFYGIDNYIKNKNVAEKEVSGILVEPLGEDFGPEFETIREEYLLETDLPQYLCLDCDGFENSIYDEIVLQSSFNADYMAYVSDDMLTDDVLEHEVPKAPAQPELNKLTAEIQPDIALADYNPQGPVVDAMRTAFFDLPGIDESIWSELSIWNRCFSNRIKTSAVNLAPNRADYKFRYILQKDKNAPLAIIYPSIGEGVMSHHSVVLAKLFYEQGYSVVIQGSHFQWEFVKSMPQGYAPGLPIKDAKYLQNTSLKIVNALQDKYDCKFNSKVVIGTSFGAMMTLFLADKESKEPILNVNRYIAVNPPIELIYAMNKFDKNTEEWNKNPDGLKERAALTAAKIMKLLDSKQLQETQKENLPFSEEEAKLITGFIMHQKLSDVIFTIENGEKSNNHTELYKMINTMNYRDYAQKYMLSDEYKSVDDLNDVASLHVIAEFLRNNDNYKIYHSVDDYLVNSSQLMKLKDYCKDKLTLMSNGSHLGFLYRKEFIESLRNEIPPETKVAQGEI